MIPGGTKSIFPNRADWNQFPKQSTLRSDAWESLPVQQKAVASVPDEPLPQTLVSPHSGGSTPIQALPPLLVDQEQRWGQGERQLVEAYVASHAWLQKQPQDILKLVLNEIELRKQKGDHPSAQEYEQRFPQFAGRLGLAKTEGMTAEKDSEPTLPAEGKIPARGLLVSKSGTPEKVGEYEIQGTLGRGGMGVVYKAWQKGLKRTVAIKMILHGRHAGSWERTRFRIEAEAAARLQHPNIIQIFDIADEGENPYLALEFVDGCSLADLLDGTPFPPRLAGQLVETLARAMQHAHERGIVHRDLKPGNILLHGLRLNGGRSGIQEALQKLSAAPQSVVPKITDFGLAKRLDIDVRQTQTGAILGTPSYMAPEQAAGRIQEIGPASDVYALGAILYDLLTGRPPFRSSTLMETLEQVQKSEPVPPVRLQPLVPRDLETICLKCLRKDPLKRYSSALALAQDLKAFLANEPITARPTPAWERAWLWARRRPAAAALLVVSAAAVLAMLIGSLLYNAALSAARYREMVQRQTAEENFKQALDAIDSMLTEVAAEELRDIPQMELARRRLLQKALLLFERFPREDSMQPGYWQYLARAHGRLGEIHDMLEDHKQSEENFDKAISILRSAIADTPDPVGQAELARALNGRGILQKKLNRLAQAEMDLSEAVKLRHYLETLQPGDLARQQETAECTYHLATVLARRGPEQQITAKKLYEQVLAVQQRLVEQGGNRAALQRDLARTYNNLGKLLKPTSKADEAEEAFTKAVAIQRELVKEQPTVPAYRRELGRTYQNLAICLWDTGKRDSAAAAFDDSGRVFRQLTLDFPNVPEYRFEWAVVDSNRGELLVGAGHLDKARTALEHSLGILKELVAGAADRPAFRREHNLVLMSLAGLESKQNRANAAESLLRTAVQTSRDLVRKYPESYDYYHDVAHALNRLADLQYLRGELALVHQGLARILDGVPGKPLAGLEQVLGAALARQESLQLLREAVALQAKALAAQPENVLFRRQLRDQHFSLAVMLWRMRLHEDLARTAELLPELSPGDYTECLLAAEFLSRAVVLAGRDSSLSIPRQEELRDSYGRLAVGMLQKAVRMGFKNANREIETLPVYKPLRERPDYKNLLEDLRQTDAGRAIG